jgi:hypothetical protein
MVSDDVVAGNQPYRLRTLARERQAGVHLLRQSFDWRALEPRPGRYKLHYYDDFVEALARNRIRLLPVLGDPPRFRSSRPAHGAHRGVYPPKRFADMGALASALVKRYGPRGSFWRERPGVPKVPIRSWQIWNEPSLPVYWASGPNPAAYVRLLRVVGKAIKRSDARAEIVSAGLPESRLGVPFKQYLNGMYDAGAAGSFDTLAVHPYAKDAAGAVDALQEARRITDRRGDHPLIWVTELGWASGGVASPFTVGEREQARLLSRTLRELGRRRVELGVRGVVVYDWRDLRPYAGARDFFGYHTGLLDVNGRPKPAFAAFRSAVRSLSR